MIRNKKGKSEYQAGKVWPLVKIAVGLVRDDPSLMLPENESQLKYELLENVPELKNQKVCANCGGSMRINMYTASVAHAVLLVAMARAVRDEVDRGVEFTKANRVHVDRLNIATSLKKQNSQLGYLGMIKPVVTNRRSGYWVITGWGWKALRGEKIPKAVKYWHGRMIERSDDMTTLSEMMRTHKDKIEKQLRFGKAVKRMDHRSEIAGYDPVEWVQFGGYIQDNF